MPIVAAEVVDYLESLFPATCSVQLEMEQFAREQQFPIVGPLVGGLLSLLARSIHARRVLDLGSGFGYSALWFARGMTERGSIECCDASSRNLNLAHGWLDKAGFGGVMRGHSGDAVDLLKAPDAPFANQQFDIIFNDVNKEDYPDLIEPALARLRSGGLFVTDNVLWKGKVADVGPDDETTRAVVEFNRRLVAHPQLDVSILPLRDGLAIALKK